MMSDQIAALLAEHQMRATLTDACTCGAGDMDTLCETGTAINRHRRHVALVIECEFRRRIESAVECCARPAGVCFPREVL